MALDDDSCNKNNNNGGRPEAGLDRLSDLPDDILVLVLEKLRDGGDDDDVRLLARTCVLSKRWRSLPLMVSRLKMSVRSFDPPGRRLPLPFRCLHEATSKFTDALRFFLATPGGQRDMKRHLILRFYLTKHHRRMLEIGRLLSDAVGRGEVQTLAIVVDTAEDDICYLRRRRRGRHADDEAAVALGLRYARRFMRLFRAAAAPSAVVGSSLTHLALRNLCFRRASDLESVLRACEALVTLHLDGACWFLDSSSSWSIDAPRSQLRDLKITGCDVEEVHVVRLPRLLRLICVGWSAQACPVTFGRASAPALKWVTLVNRSAPGQMSFKLSDLRLENANPVEYLCLDFDDDKVWVQPEKQINLRAAFSKLKELHVTLNTDISWTTFLIKAAPLLELVDIHVCSDAGEDAQDMEWEEEDVSDHFEHHHLHTVKIGGTIVDADGDGDPRFLRLVLERAVNLDLLLLLNDGVTCPDCISVAAQQEDRSCSVLPSFPEDKDGIDAFVMQLKDGIPTSARIVVVHTPSNQEFRY